MIHPQLTKTFIEEVRMGEAERPEDHAPVQAGARDPAEGGRRRDDPGRSPRDLGISPHTVKTHLERIFEKLGANDRAQAVAIAIRTGIVH